ncbi:serine/threonine-protein kinase [Actinoplanes sp. KI2]|uniref:WD40 repeat domain-containing serine/threonine protein kinase n=1 Tax=Actinoplanes sp. KI2 TaxID=2983315 RepID=UPI0021D610B9|nr:serine/threonine-protein kinase [Actinoplanes sp. KI2]MCU7723086.1 serine/threonine-protein kinase [Actinoplanes sp. KI2]
MTTSALRIDDPVLLGGYELLARLGEGGMGTVYLAKGRNGRPVALKVIKPENSRDAEFRARFRSEVEKARRVPPFCTAEVLDADPDHETPYLVVEYVDGPSLADVVHDQGPLSAATVHGVAIGVATALVAIHGAGIIHRDLKPANVLFALGTPKVIDFGIAQPTVPTSQHTRPDLVVGTLAYMAPERFDTDRRRPLTPAADVFAWGVVVTYAATGHLPFAGDSPAATAGMILIQPPDLDGLTGGLRDLVAAALEKDPARRPTAAELLDRLLTAVPVGPEVRRAAYAARDSERSRRTTRRIVRTTAAACALVLAAGVPAGIVMRQRAADRQDAAAALRVARTAVADNLVTQSRDVRPTDPGLSLRLAATAMSLTPGESTRANLTDALDSGYLGEIPARKAVSVARYRPDGKVVALAGTDGTLTFWAGDTPVGTLNTRDQLLNDIAFSPDGKTLAAIGKRLQLWDVHDLGAPRLLSSAAADGGDGRLVEFAGPGKLVAGAGAAFTMWDLADPQHPRRLWRVGGPDGYAGAAAANGARGLYLLETDDNVTVFSGTGQAKPHEVAHYDKLGSVRDIAINPAGTLVAIALQSVDNPVWLYDLSDRAVPRRLVYPPDATHAVRVAFAPDGSRLAAVDDDRHVTLWDVRNPSMPILTGTRDGNGDAVTSVTFAPGGGTLLTTSLGVTRTAMLWSTASPLAPARIASVVQPGPVESLDVSATGTLAVESRTGQGSAVASWDVADPAHPRVVSRPAAVHENAANGGAVRMSREQPTVALVGRGLWELGGSHPRRLLPAGVAVRDFDPAAGLAVVDSGTAPILYAVAADQAPRRLASIPMPKPSSASFVRGRKELVVMSSVPGEDEVISLWDLTDPAHPRHLSSRQYAGFGAGSAASADGAAIAYWTIEEVHLWRPDTGADTLLLSGATRRRLGGSGQILGAAFAMDGSVLALSTAERVELWSVPATGQAALLAVLRGQFDGTATGRDRPILAVGDGAYVNIWDLDRTTTTLRDPLPAACRLGGGLTPAEWPRYVKDLAYTPAC